MTAEDFLAELAVSLRGPRRRRKRLVDEMAAHIDDAIRAELATNAPRVEAERIVLDRLGCADVIARRWNGDRRVARGRRRRRLAAIAFAGVAAAALGVTQYAAGKPELPRRDPPARMTPERVPTHSNFDRSENQNEVDPRGTERRSN
jgi:HAAS domain-containing protein